MAETKYGNVTLGMYYEFLYEFLGQDIFTFYYDKYYEMLPLEQRQQLDATKKQFKRLFQESGIDLKKLYPKNNPILEITKIFFKEAVAEWNCSEEILELLLSLGWCITDFFTYCPGYSPRGKTVDKPIFCSNYETKTSDTFYTHFLFPRFYNGVIKIPNARGDLLFYTKPVQEQYKDIFEKITEKYGGKEGFYNFLDEDFPREKDDEKTTERFKKIISEAQKIGKQPTWKNFYYILNKTKKIDKNLCSKLLGTFLVSNLETAIKNVMQVPYEKLEDFKKVLKEYAHSGDVEKTFFAAEQLEFKIMFTEKNINAFRDVYELFGNIFIVHIYLHNESKVDEFCEALKKSAPHASAFFIPWARGYIAVAHRDFENAQKLYKEAFDNGRRFAGTLFETFLKQAIAMEIYYSNNPDSVRKSLENDSDNQNPINSNAKTYMNYGFALGILDRSADDAYREHFDRINNFYEYFPKEIFFQTAIEKEIEKEDFIIANAISFNAPDISELYKTLSALNESNINKRIPMRGLKEKQYTPLSLCMINSEHGHTEFLELALRWLGESGDKPTFKTLDVNELNFNGSTALHEVLTQYKRIRQVCVYENMNEDRKISHNLYKKITMRIIELADVTSFCETKFNLRIHTLQEAIDSYDAEIVEAIVNKGLDLNALRISLDEASPIYHTVSRFYFIEKKDSIYETPIEQQNIVWKNSSESGLTAEDRFHKFHNMMQDSEFSKIFTDILKEKKFNPMLGHESTYETQKRELLKILDFLCSKTNDVDDFKMHFHNTKAEYADLFLLKNKNVTPYCTTLYLAVETDNVELCRILLKHGANPNLVLDRNPPFWTPNDFFYRAIFFKSWNIIKFCLTELKDEIQQEINRTEGPLELTPLTYLMENIFISENKNLANDINEFQQILPLFKIAGAYFSVPFRGRTAKEFIESNY